MCNVVSTNCKISRSSQVLDLHKDVYLSEETLSRIFSRNNAGCCRRIRLFLSKALNSNPINLYNVCKGIHDIQVNVCFEQDADVIPS